MTQTTGPVQMLHIGRHQGQLNLMGSFSLVTVVSRYILYAAWCESVELVVWRSSQCVTLKKNDQYVHNSPFGTTKAHPPTVFLGQSPVVLPQEEECHTHRDTRSSSP